MTGRVQPWARIARALTAKLLVLSITMHVPAALAQALGAPTIAVTPSAGLQSGWIVDVVATGIVFPDPPPDPAMSDNLKFAMCPVGDASRCWSNWPSVQRNPDGSFTNRLQMPAVFPHPGALGAIDCRTEPCELRAAFLGDEDYGNPVTGPGAPLDFDHAGPESFAPAVRLEPHTTLIDGQLVTVTATHLQLCNGFFPNECQMPTELLLCNSALTNCQQSPLATITTPLSTDATVTTQISLPAQFSGFGGSVDCRVEPCVVLVRRTGATTVASEVLTFAPSPVIVAPHFTG